MNRGKLIFLVFIFCANKLFTQNISVVPQVGFMFQSVYFESDSRVLFKPALNYGGTVFFKLDNMLELGLNAAFSRTKADIRSHKLDTLNIPFSLNYYQVTLIRNIQLPLHKMITPYFGVDLGAKHIYDIGSNKNILRTNIGLRGGLKFLLSRTVFLSIQADITSPLYGLGIGFGSGSGLSGQGSLTGSFFQYGFSMGLGVKLEKIKH